MSATHTGFTKVSLDAFEGVAEEAGVAKPDPIVVADSVTRRFGGLTAVRVDHFEIQREAITALIGPNGAGKTTFFNVITGFDKANAGRWSFEEQDITGLSGYKVAQRGMVRTFQLTKALSRLKVIENMKLGAPGQSGERFLSALVRPRWRHQEQAIEEKADELLERFRLSHMRDEFAGALSGGQRKLLEMARALMSDPKLIMLDEPMAGVNPALAQTIVAHVKTLADDGLTVLFVEHDMDVVRTISDWVVVMAEGEIVAEGRHGSIVANPRVIDAYLGAHHATPLDRSEQDRQLAEAESELDRQLAEAESELDRQEAEAESEPDQEELSRTEDQ